MALKDHFVKVRLIVTAESEKEAEARIGQVATGTIYLEGIEHAGSEPFDPQPWRAPLTAYQEAEMEVNRIIRMYKGEPSLEAQLRIIEAFVHWAVVAEQAELPIVWTVFNRARVLMQTLHAGRLEA